MKYKKAKRNGHPTQSTPTELKKELKQAYKTMVNFKPMAEELLANVANLLDNNSAMLFDDARTKMGDLGDLLCFSLKDIDDKLVSLKECVDAFNTPKVNDKLVLQTEYTKLSEELTGALGDAPEHYVNLLELFREFAESIKVEE